MSGLVVLGLAVLFGAGATWLLVRMDDRINRLDAKLSVLAHTVLEGQKDGRR